MDTTATSASQADAVAQAVEALTAAAKGPGDFAEIACRVVTTVAANVGGIDELLARRPGSWEAAYVRDMVTSTAGEDPDDLMRWRTAPVRLVLDVLEDLHLEDLYDEALDVYGEQERAAADALIDDVITDDEQARAEKLSERAPTLLAAEGGGNPDSLKIAREEAFAIIDRVMDRGREAGHPQFVAMEAARRRYEAVEELWKRDHADYAEAFTQTVRRLIAKRGGDIPIEVVQLDPATSEDAPERDALAAALYEAARKATPLPMTGAVPDWTPGATVAHLRETRRTYLDRTADK